MAILQHQALTDPVGALEKALGLPQSARDRGLAGIFRTWMDLDSDAAVSWLKGQKPEVLSGALAGGVLAARFGYVALFWVSIAIVLAGAIIGGVMSKMGLGAA